MDGFSCSQCGSPSIKLPRSFDDDTDVECARCHCTIGTWSSFKRLADQAIKASHSHETGRPSSLPPSGRKPHSLPIPTIITRRAVNFRWFGTDDRDPDVQDGFLASRQRQHS